MSAWQIPAHRVQEYAPRQQRYALVIPVINEGERIQHQLQAIAALRPPLDIVIADGGSQDGSLADDFLQRVGVRALLTKTGPGKLSAQLRMAYGWCLTQGYDGIITVDGNGKDGMEALPVFCQRLDAGYDYVQGSRYRPGGAAINTPADRHWAGRLIHAPLISLAGRRWLTDTTNGYRAYSARYLSDPRVQPFRDCFMVYNLLFYLSVRAGQLGYRVTELPVVRRYPAHGPTPTKIGGWHGKLLLLTELLRTVRGDYHPQ